MGDEEGRERFRERQERRIARRRKRILLAAAGLFSQRGFASTTIREIAEAADMAEGTLYNYFRSKREILLAIARESEAPMVTALGDMGELSDRESIVAMFEKALHISEQQLPFTQTLLNEAWLDDGILQEFVVTRLLQIHKVLVDYIGSQVEVGRFRPVDAQLAAQLVIGMFVGLILPALRGLAPLPSPEDRRFLAERVVGMMLDGVLARDESP